MDQNFTRVKTVSSGSLSTTDTKDLISGKTYYYKVRAYRNLNGKNYYGSYSSILTTSTNK